MIIKFKKIHPDAVTPEYKTPGAAAFDIALIENVEIQPRGIAKTRTGLVIATPKDHVLILAPRSSSGPKRGFCLTNGIGIIDSDYCGPNDEIQLALLNITDEIVNLKAGERVAQGMILPAVRGNFEEVEEMDSPNRGGFGSTGN